MLDCAVGFIGMGWTHELATLFQLQYMCLASILAEFSIHRGGDSRVGICHPTKSVIPQCSGCPKNLLNSGHTKFCLWIYLLDVQAKGVHKYSFSDVLFLVV